MNRIYILGCALLGTLTLYAQDIAVSGKVTSDGEPLAGVTITVKNRASQGTITDIDGNYRITVKGDDELLFSFIGYNTFTQKVNNNRTIHVELEESAIQLEELVITVPYGTAKKSTFTGSAGYVSGSTIEKAQVSNVTKALQGTVPGLQSFSSSGQPGSEATIRIRGVGSVNASSDPLYVVDGVPYAGNLSALASSDIESVTVLKDAASATLYGSRAANGVIMITTRQGKRNQKPQIEFTSKFGFSSRGRKDYKQVNTNEYFELYWEAIRNERLDSNDTAADAATFASRNLVSDLGINPYGSKYAEPVGTDGKLLAGLTPLWNDSWEDALTQNAHYTDLNVHVSGGGQSSTYFISGGYLDDQGVAIESGFKRYTLRTNVVSDIRKWLQVGLNVSGSHSIQDYPKQDDSISSNVILAARALPSFYPVYVRDPDAGAYVYDENGNRIFDFGEYRPNSFKRQNLLATMPLDKKEIKRDIASLRGYIQIEPVTGLTWRTSLNVDYNSRYNHYYEDATYEEASSTGGSIERYNARTVGTTINNVVNYATSFNRTHDLRVMAGHEYYEYNTSNFGGERQNVIASGYYEPDAASVLVDFYGNSDQYKLLSFFGSAEYSYKKKYFLSASVRTDGSSRFHPDKRWGTFWSVGGSWRIIEEDFLEEARISGQLSNLSLRASYGAQGNDNISYYAYQALYSIYNNLGESGLTASRLATPDLTWETNLNLNIGLDLGFFNNRLSGTIEYFERRSKDLLFSKSLVPSTGFSSTSQNTGAIRNYGWEFLVEGYPIVTKDWRWKLSVNATTYKNKIVSLPSEEMWSGSKKWVKGGSLYDFYLIEWAGVNPENGNPQWYRYTDDGDKIVTEDYSSVITSDKVKAGSSLPKLTGGFQSELSYKGFELSALFSYVIGGKIYNSDKIFLLSQGSPGRAWSTDMLNRWTPENPYTDVARLTTSPESSWTNESTRFLVDRSFLKLKTVTLSYTLPASWTQAASLHSTSLFVQGENLFTATKEQGLDPEQTLGGTTYYRYPSMRTISFGINIKL